MQRVVHRHDLAVIYLWFFCHFISGRPALYSRPEDGLLYTLFAKKSPHTGGLI